MAGFNEEFSRIAKNFKDLAEFGINGIQKLFNFGAKGSKLTQTGLIGLYWGVAAILQVAFAPWLFSKLGNGVLALANSDSILMKFAIQTVGNFSYRTLSLLEHLPVVGTLFSKAYLPWAVTGVIGVLFASNLLQVINEQNKTIRQQLNSLKQINKKAYDEINGYDLVLISDLRDNNVINAEPYKLYLSNDGKYIARDLNGKVHQSSLPKNLVDLTDLDEKLNNPEFKSKVLDYTSKEGHTVKGNLFRYLQFYATTVASTGFEEAVKASSMRFVLSMGVPAFAFFFACLCKVQPGIALSNAVWLSVAGWALPYGAIGALGAVHKGYTSIYETLWPIDHNKARADRAKLEKQQALEEEQLLDKKGDRGHRLTDEPNLGQFTNNLNTDPNPLEAAAQKEAESAEKRRLALEAHYSRHPVVGKTPQEAAQEALQPRPVPVVMSRVSPVVEPVVANAGQQLDNTATAQPGQKPSFD